MLKQDFFSFHILSCCFRIRIHRIFFPACLAPRRVGAQTLRLERKSLFVMISSQRPKTVTVFSSPKSLTDAGGGLCGLNVKYSF